MTGACASGAGGGGPGRGSHVLAVTRGAAGSLQPNGGAQPVPSATPAGAASSVTRVYNARVHAFIMFSLDTEIFRACVLTFILRVGRNQI